STRLLRPTTTATAASSSTCCAASSERTENEAGPGSDPGARFVVSGGGYLVADADRAAARCRQQQATERRLVLAQAARERGEHGRVAFARVGVGVRREAAHDGALRFEEDVADAHGRRPRQLIPCREALD